MFVPTDVSFPAAKKQRLASLVAAANDGGFPLRVALVANAYELGAVAELWRRPRSYARFAGAELRAEGRYSGRVLVAMPDGFGFSGPRQARAYAVLGSIRIGPGSAGLIDGAIAAVQRLAEDAGVKLAPPPAGAGRSATSDRLRIVAAAGGGLVLVLAGRGLLRRRRA